MSFSPEQKLKQAFLQLEFSIKLFRYFERHEINKESFDCHTKIILPDGEWSFPKSSFNTYDDLILASQNVYSSSLGLSAIALDTVCSEAGIANNPDDLSSKGQLRSFVYMLRCAFAHDLMLPKWEARGKYARVYELELNGDKKYIDVISLNGQGLELEDFGGFLAYLAVKEEVLSWLK